MRKLADAQTVADQIAAVCEQSGKPVRAVCKAARVTSLVWQNLKQGYLQLSAKQIGRLSELTEIPVLDLLLPPTDTDTTAISAAAEKLPQEALAFLLDMAEVRLRSYDDRRNVNFYFRLQGYAQQARADAQQREP